MLKKMEHPLAHQERMEVRMNIYLDEIKTNQKVHQVKEDANLKELREGIKGNQPKAGSCLERMEAFVVELRACRRETVACQEVTEARQKNIPFLCGRSREGVFQRLWRQWVRG
jgi:hypothetical protein